MRCTERCPDCPSRKLPTEEQKPIVSGDYPDDEGTGGVLFVGEAPGREENNRRRVFCGRTGDEFNNTYLPLAGLSRSSINITNTVKCHWADSSDAPPESLVRSCSEFHLRRELAHYRPRIVVLMGSVANSLLDLDVELEHGMVRDTEILGHTTTVFSTFHPALGLHKSDAMLSMLDSLDGDFPRLGRLLKGKLPRLVDSCPQPEFERIRKPRHIRSIMGSYRYFEPIAVDTESKKRWRGFPSTERYTPYCATWCHEEGAAYMVKVEDEDSMRTFLDELVRFSTIIMQNSPHDHEVLTMVAGDLHPRWELPWRKIKDTMQMAYNDGRMLKGLKPMAYRLLGHRMTSFDEVVVPASRNIALDYLVDALAVNWPSPVQVSTGKQRWGNCPECKGKGKIWNGVRGKGARYWPCDCNSGKVLVEQMTRKQGINEKLSRLATDMTNKDVDIWDRWNGWGEKDPGALQVVINRLGPIPLPSIEFVKEDRQITYACGDAHDTWRLYWPLTKRLVDIRRAVSA